MTTRYSAYIEIKNGNKGLIVPCVFQPFTTIQGYHKGVPHFHLFFNNFAIVWDTLTRSIIARLWSRNTRNVLLLAKSKQNKQAKTDFTLIQHDLIQSVLRWRPSPSGIWITTATTCEGFQIWTCDDEVCRLMNPIPILESRFSWQFQTVPLLDVFTYQLQLLFK
jgi:hypothetical protein